MCVIQLFMLSVGYQKGYFGVSEVICGFSTEGPMSVTRHHLDVGCEGRATEYPSLLA